MPKAAAETTQLTPAEQPRFQAWVKRNRITDLDHPDSHYDYRGFWRQNPTFTRASGQHLTDEFKQHGHPTFSVESRYSRGVGDGGRWGGPDLSTYVPAGADQLATSRRPPSRDVGTATRNLVASPRPTVRRIRGGRR